MAQLYFKYGAMGSSKTANALMARFNYEERGQATLLVKPRLDTRDGDHMVSSRIGLTHPCIYFDEMQQMTDEQLQQYACIIVDEAQFLQKADIYYLVHLVDDCNIPVLCYGLRADFRGELFEGSYHLLVLADKLVPWCLGATVVTYLLTRNATRAISCLMVDFSCALKLSMPLAVLSAMRECGSYHITVKGGKYLEALSQADTIVFDKTGTLTRATPQVVEVVPFSGCNEREVLQLAACLEEHFPHSMANAVVRAAKERGISHEEMHSEVEYIVAHGIASRVGGQRVVIGSHHFVFEDEKCTIPTAEQQKFDALKPAYSHLYMAASGQLVGVICISDPLRPEAAAVLNGLRALGIRNTVMMTGDSERTAAAIAKQVGVDRFFAEVLPEDKANFVQQAKAEGHTVVMIGDGINDSPALSAADIGIAINSGAAIAREIADVTIKADSLEELVALKAIANSLQKRVHANYRFVLTFNSALIALGALGILQPASSAMLHNLSTIGISLKSMTNLLPENKAPQLKA